MLQPQHASVRHLSVLTAYRAAISFFGTAGTMEPLLMKLLTNVQTAALIGLKPNTLEIWRVQGQGPVFRKLGRTVRYVEADVLAWIDLYVCASTSDYPARQDQDTQAALPRTTIV